MASDAVRGGYLAPGWPTEYGGAGLSALEQVILAEEFAKAGVPTGGPNDVFGIQMLGNTLLQWGTDEQKEHYLPRILSGEDTWCQGYCEPNAGSDLSNVGLRGVLDGDQWVLNGQKIWTSAGHLADHIFTLVRTDPDAPKHKGISFMLVDMRQPGIEVRPIKMISGESEFNEIFYTDATAPKDEVVGGVNNGWAVAMTLLGYERGEAAATVPIRYPGRARPAARRWPRSAASTTIPIIRQRLAWCYGKVQIMRYNGMRTLTKFLHGSPPRPGRRDLQAVLERVPQGRHRAGRRHPRGRGDGAHRPPPVDARSRPTTPARRTARGAGSARSSTRGPARSTPGRRRSSATSSARWCSACRRSRRRLIDVASATRAIARASRRRPIRDCGSRAWRQYRRVAAATLVAAPPFLPVPPGDYVRFRLQTQYGSVDHRIEAADVLNYLSWCKSNRALAS